MGTLDKKAIDMGGALGYLTAALKELHARNEVLRARIEALEKKKAELGKNEPRTTHS